MTDRIRWGILGPGRIAAAFAQDLHLAAGAERAAVGSRDLARARAFADEHGFARAYGSYAELAADPEVDAVYVASPHSHHCEHALLALEHGKHVLCEKPLAVNADEAERMIAAARGRGVALLDGMWTRFLPAFVRLRELVDGGAIGRVRQVTAHFGFRAPFDPSGRIYNPELAGGALLDVGVYPVTLASMLLGAPATVTGAAHLGATGVDEISAAVLAHEGGALAVLSMAVALDSVREAAVLGDEGMILIPEPWWRGQQLVVKPRGGEPQTLDLPFRGHGFVHEAEAFMDLIRGGETESPVMPWDESLAIMRTMDELRRQWGLRYPQEPSTT
jgi:dihydrodiol dehydrogenase / D-xylose 1-dehydrogenase (NADP)